MRVLGGIFRSRRLQAPKGSKVRPTSALLRQALFQIVKNEIEGAYFLDLFAGSGAMGIEALSQGAFFSVFVDEDRRSIDCIRKNIESLALQEKSEIFLGEALSLLSKEKIRRFSFDIVFVDPPYIYYEREPFIEKVLALVEKSILLKEGGSLFFESPILKQFPPPKVFGSFFLKSSRHFGDTFLHHYFFRNL